MNRLLSLLLFFVFLCAASECMAQRPRLFKRTNASPRLIQPQYQSVHQAAPVEIGRYSSYRNPFVSKLLDGPTTPGRRDPREVESRYIGGIHRSYFNNIGIPSGDIGIRGNALNWDTWNW